MSMTHGTFLDRGACSDWSNEDDTGAGISSDSSDQPLKRSEAGTRLSGYDLNSLALETTRIYSPPGFACSCSPQNNEPVVTVEEPLSWSRLTNGLYLRGKSYLR